MAEIMQIFCILLRIKFIVKTMLRMEKEMENTVDRWLVFILVI